MMIRWISAAVFAVWAIGAGAAPERYVLDARGSTIGFAFSLEGAPVTGKVPVAAAHVVVDFDNLAASQVTAQFDITRSDAGNVFMTEAMLSASVLNASAHPQAVFRSRRVVPVGAGARLEGDLTLRGVTRPVVLDGQIFRKRGSDPGDLDNLVLIFTGAVSRAEFGATGFQRVVADRVELEIIAAIRRAE
ncbi:YceI family protein [Yoonia sp. R2331]|uniref:YceI family protein n=1 Tax=Yoonia sp. R2331 TaxID=3237238 RepID=UPI0034E3C227